MVDHRIVLGYVPVRRDMFPAAVAAATEKQIRSRVEEILSHQHDIQLLTIDDITDGGILCSNRDVEKIERYFREKNVDAVFFPHCNFGQEEPVAQLAKRLNLPVLLWGPRDPAPEGEAFRVYDTQCGLFATSKALTRAHVPFTYIENCWLDAPELEDGIDRFLRVASVVKAMRHMRVGQFGMRPRQFLSVKINESELMEKFGIEITPIWTEEVTQVVRKLRSGKTNTIGAMMGIELPYAGWASEEGTPDPRIRERMEDIASKYDCSAIGEEVLEKIAVIELAVEELARINNLDCLAFECWAYLAANFGIQACFILGDLIDRGLVAACETDLHAAITARLLQAAARGESAPFIADLTIRHPTNDNAELLWHCGPFAYSLHREGSKPRICNCKGYFELKHGEVTVARLDQADGNYLLFADEVQGVDGPVTNGNYLWIETSNWPEWEKKLIYGPYIHHVCGVHGSYADVLKEATKYIGNVQHDSVNSIFYR